MAMTKYQQNQDTLDQIQVPGDTAGQSVSQPNEPGCNEIQTPRYY